MRNWSSLIVLASATALSGCAGTALDQISALNTDCSVSQTAVNCGPTTPPTTPTPTTPPPPVTNTSGLTSGDTTIALEKDLVVNGKTAISKITYDTTADTAAIEFNTNTAGNAQWPSVKTMKRYTVVGGTGLGADYKEFRAYDKGKYDEELQVWSWNKNATTGKYNSYATQYRDVTNGGSSPAHQAWSFGGQYTTAAAMPTTGTATYSGQFVATAQSSNWTDTKDDLQVLSYNNNWRVSGTSALTADFGTKQVNGALTPTAWIGKTKDGGWADAITAGGVNHHGFMDSKIILKGTISTSTSAGAKPNQITGTADIDPAAGWLNSSSNTMSAGFFGDNGASANEITGVFAASATAVAPTGPDRAIDDDRRGYLSISGLFHAQ